MRLLCFFAVILALSLAEESKDEHLKDLVAEETVASAYNTYVPPSQRPWNPPQNYVPQNTWPQIPQQNPVNYIPTSPPLPPQNDYVPPQNSGYWPPQNTWKPPHHPVPVTTPTTVIKNEQYYGDNGNYKYEYQYSDGTHVGENGYRNGPNEEDIVKQGWYSYPDANGKIYTVKWWADYTGFHAYGDHLPTPPTVPKAIQKALDESAQSGDEKPQSYSNNLNPTQHVQDQSYPGYPQKPVEYQPQQTYPTYQ